MKTIFVWALISFEAAPPKPPFSMPRIEIASYTLHETRSDCMREKDHPTWIVFDRGADTAKISASTQQCVRIRIPAEQSR